jgi:hypothetical protein
MGVCDEVSMADRSLGDELGREPAPGTEDEGDL